MRPFSRRRDLRGVAVELTCTLGLLLHGPLQSWGDRSKLGVRETADAPTRSGIMGLLRAAAGSGRADATMLRQLSDIQLLVRADRPGRRLRDYHTITADPPVAYSAGSTNSEPDHPTTIISNRWYLSDAAFLVLCCGTEQTEPLLRELLWQLMHPVWHLSMGRRACPPTEPLLLGISYCNPLGLIEELPRLSNSSDETTRVSVWAPHSMAGPCGSRWGAPIQSEEAQTVPVGGLDHQFTAETRDRYELPRGDAASCDVWGLRTAFERSDTTTSVGVRP